MSTAAESIIVHVHWSGPYTIDTITALNNPTYDYGVYQVYGSHPIYGTDVLIYIGKANDQTFSKRLKQEGWDYHHDSGNVMFYVGRLAGPATPKNQDWADEIDKTEALLIHSHWPANNSKNIQTICFDQLRNLHILNWGDRRALMPEVSGHRMTDEYWNIPNYHCYGDEQNVLEAD